MYSVLRIWPLGFIGFVASEYWYQRNPLCVPFGENDQKDSYTLEKSIGMIYYYYSRILK